MPVAETTKGLIGEYICAVSLLGLGWKVSMAQQDSVDLIAWKGDQYLRVQVKSASLRLEKSRITAIYHFNNGSGRNKKVKGIESYDILAHVGINHRRVVFNATEQVQVLSQRYRKEYFEKNDVEYFSFEKALQIVNQRRLQ
jgi:hypothetical protein